MLTRIVLTLAITTLFSWPAVRSESVSPNVEKGRQFAEEYCADCNAIGATDMSALAEAPPFRALGKNYNVEHLAEALAEGIVTGHADMPEFTLGSQEVEDFIGYLVSIQEAR